MRDQIAKLEAENKDLKEEKQKMEESAGLGGSQPPAIDGAPGAAGSEPPAPKSTLPDEKDVDRMFDYVEGMMKKFKERIEKMQKEEKEKQGTPL